MPTSKPKKMQIKLGAVPNPDFPESRHLGSVKIKLHRVEVSDLKEARDKARKFIEENELGSGNWVGGAIYENGKQVAYVSYNGRVWEGNPHNLKPGKAKEIILEEGGAVKAPKGVVVKEKMLLGTQYTYWFRNGHLFTTYSSNFIKDKLQVKDLHRVIVLDGDNPYIYDKEQFIKEMQELFKGEVSPEEIAKAVNSKDKKDKITKVELTYIRTDADTGNFIYRGSDGDKYVSVEGVIHDMTTEGEPDTPVHNVAVKKGEPIYDPADRFGRKVGSKVQMKRGGNITSGCAVVYTHLGKHYLVEVDNSSQAELVDDILWLYRNGEADIDHVNMTISSYGEPIELKEYTPVGGKYKSEFYKKQIPILFSVNLDMKSPGKTNEDGGELPDEDSKELKSLNKMLATYGWRAEDSGEVTKMINRNGKVVALIQPVVKKVKGGLYNLINGKYEIVTMAGRKILSGRGELEKSAQKVVRDYFYASPITKPMVIDELGYIEDEHGITVFNRKKNNINVAQISKEGTITYPNSSISTSDIEAIELIRDRYKEILKKGESFKSGGIIDGYRSEQLPELFNEGDQFKVHGFGVLEGRLEPGGIYDVVKSDGLITYVIDKDDVGNIHKEPMRLAKNELLPSLNNYIEGDGTGIELLKSKGTPILKKHEKHGWLFENGGTIDLMFGELGNGLTVSDRNRNHINVAHISDNGVIKYYVKNLPDSAIKQIEEERDWYVNILSYLQIGELYVDKKTFKVRTREGELYYNGKDLQDAIDWATKQSAKGVYSQGGASYKKGGKLCPTGTEIETLLFSKSKFTVESAREWAWNHGEDVLRWATPDVTENNIRVRQKPLDHFRKGTFRTIDITDGVKAVVGCPMSAHRSYKTGGKVVGVYYSKDGLTKFSVIPAGRNSPELPETIYGPDINKNHNKYWRIVLERADHNAGQMDEAHDDWFENEEDANLEAMRLANVGEKGAIKYETGGAVTEKKEELPVIKANYHIEWKGKRYPARRILISENGDDMEVIIAPKELHNALKRSKMVGKAGELNRMIYHYIADDLVEKMTDEELIKELIASGHKVKMAKYKKGGKVKKFKKEKKERPHVPHFAEPTNFDIRISKPLATFLLRKGAAILDKGVSVMCKEMGTGDLWREITKEDLVFMQIPSKYKTFELWIDGTITAPELKVELEKFITENKIK